MKTRDQLVEIIIWDTVRTIDQWVGKGDLASLYDFLVNIGEFDKLDYDEVWEQAFHAGLVGPEDYNHEAN